MRGKWIRAICLGAILGVAIGYGLAQVGRPSAPPGPCYELANIITSSSAAQACPPGSTLTSTTLGLERVLVECMCPPNGLPLDARRPDAGDAR